MKIKLRSPESPSHKILVKRGSEEGQGVSIRLSGDNHNQSAGDLFVKLSRDRSRGGRLVRLNTDSSGGRQIRFPQLRKSGQAGAFDPMEDAGQESGADNEVTVQDIKNQAGDVLDREKERFQAAQAKRRAHQATTDAWENVVNRGRVTPRTAGAYAQNTLRDRQQWRADNPEVVEDYSNAWRELRGNEEFNDATEQQRRQMVADYLYDNAKSEKTRQWLDRRAYRDQYSAEGKSPEQLRQDALNARNQEQDIDYSERRQSRNDLISEQNDALNEIDSQIADYKARAADGEISPRAARAHINQLNTEKERLKKDHYRRMKQHREDTYGGVRNTSSMVTAEVDGQGRATYRDPESGEMVRVTGDTEEEAREKARQQQRQAYQEYTRDRGTPERRYRWNHERVYQEPQRRDTGGSGESEGGEQEDVEMASSPGVGRNSVSGRTYDERMAKWMAGKAKYADDYRKWIKGELPASRLMEIRQEVPADKKREWTQTGESRQALAEERSLNRGGPGTRNVQYNPQTNQWESTWGPSNTIAEGLRGASEAGKSLGTTYNPLYWGARALEDTANLATGTDTDYSDRAMKWTNPLYRIPQAGASAIDWIWGND